MPSPNILPPNPSLVAILLVIKSLSGPRLVFHYPPHPVGPANATPQHPQWYGTSGSTLTDDDDDSTSSTTSSGWSSEGGDSDAAGSDEASEAEGASRAGSRGTSKGTSRGTGLRDGRSRGQRSLRSASEDVTEEIGDDDDTGLRDEEGRGGAGGSGPPGKKGGISAQEDGGPEWESVMGFKTEGLEKLLCPGKSFNKRKFEVGMEGLSFLGHPMFAKGNGAWRKRRRSEKKREAANQEELRDNGNGQESDGHESALADDEDEGVDVTGPEDALEYQLRTGEMYDNVIRKFAKDLKYEQAKTNYVWRESKIILNLKNKAKENREPMSMLWHSIISSSPLAKAIAIIYDAISNNKIAHINLATLADASYQIPQAPSTPYIPRPTEPQMPGLWLTTANLPDENTEADPAFTVALTPHSALLLLEDKETLLKEIEGDAKEHSAQLAFYISNLEPTRSLHKLALQNKIPVADLEFIAAHLIYWRRARAIPPLHHRDIYIVSPNADMRKLPQAIPAYAARFPTLPSLPKMLSFLSNQSPRTYGTIIPSKDHRIAYMDILAWLMRGGWVTQLRTFAWIRVSPEVQAEVATIMEREAKEAARAAMQAARERHAALELHSDDGSDRATIASDDVPSTPIHSYRREERSPRSDTASDGGYSSRTQLRASSTTSNPGGSSSLTTSPTAHRNSPLYASALHVSHSATSLTGLSTVSSNASSGMPHGTPNTPQRTANSLRHHLHHPHHLNGGSGGAGGPGASASQLHHHHGGAALGGSHMHHHAGHGHAASKDPADYAPRMIYSPQRANALEARWIEHIRSSFVSDEGVEKEVRDLWPALLKYFDGRHALDDIAGREGIKRKRVWSVLGVLRERNVLYFVRHW
ncbi:Nitrogen permease regulator 3 [Lasiodiplodia theobromae]|uniref:Nitrogen permease regulator 3 n=1 Tax=Lasiodiplodia theobromae TaxID=45133 RepID=UPI0015C3DD86|nr:Nitrogen permease regulator 3 [Lasiodiplodia theobromae]KAF4534254.1 Nitrogen permease regulator 3 [Lasiodiplodia theobromae]